jgi:WD40 repeat protein
VSILEEFSVVPASGCRCVRISPDGTSILTAGNSAAAVSDAVTGQPGWSRPWTALAEFPVEAVWGAGGDTITLLSSGRLGLIAALTGADLTVPAILAERRDVTAIALSRDGLTHAVGTQAGMVLLWRQDNGDVTRMRGGGDPVTALAWGPGDAELCVARPRSVQFWRLPAEAMISSVPVGDVYPLRLAWVPDGSLIAVAGLREVRMIDATTRNQSAQLDGLPGVPVGLGFSRTGSTLLLGLPDGSADVLDRHLQRLPVQPAPQPAALTEAACLHVSETGLVGLRTSATTVTLFRLPDTVLPDASRRIALATSRWAARVARTAGRSASADAPAPVPEVIARRSRFAWTADGWISQDRDRGTVTRHNADGRQRWQVEARPGRLAVAGEFVTVAVGDGDGHGRDSVTVLDAASGGTVAVVPGAGIPSWSGHGLAVAAPGRRDLHVHDPGWVGAQTVAVSERAGDPAWSPDGHWLAAVTAGALVVWDGQSLARTRSMPLGDARRPGAARWSPDGRWLAVDRPGRRVTVYDVRSWIAGQPLTESTVGESPLALAWSPDSRLLAIPSIRVLGAVDLWDTRLAAVAMTIPAPPSVYTAVMAVAWASDGRFAATHGDGTVVRWSFSVPLLPGDGAADLPYPARTLAELAAATAAVGTAASLPFLADLLSLLSGRPTGRLAEFDAHPGVALLRGLRWSVQAAVGLAVLIASGLPSEASLGLPDGALDEDMRAAVEQALGGVPVPAEPYQVPAAGLLRELDRVDDSVLLLATLLGPEAVAAQPSLLARVRGHSFSGWSIAPRQRRLLGLRSMVRLQGDAQGQGLGDTRAGIARNGQLPSLLPSELALPRDMLTAKKARDELLFRTRQGSLPTAAVPVVLLLDDTPAAFGAVGVTIRVVANLIAGLALQRQRRCALVTLGNPAPRLLSHASDLIHVWAGGTLNQPDVPAALAAAAAAAAQLSDSLDGLPRLVLLTHPYLACPSRPELHQVRVHYPGIPVEDPSPRTHILAPDAEPEQFREVIAAILSDRS